MNELITTILDIRKDLINFGVKITFETMGLDHQADHEKRDEKTNKIKPEKYE